MFSFFYMYIHNTQKQEGEEKAAAQVKLNELQDRVKEAEADRTRHQEGLSQLDIKLAQLQVQKAKRRLAHREG